jgi:hypothetical protein
LVRAGLAPAQAGNRKGLPLLFEKMQLNLAKAKRIQKIIVAG